MNIHLLWIVLFSICFGWLAHWLCDMLWFRTAREYAQQQKYDYLNFLAGD